MHWSLDIAFRENESRLRERNAAQNAAVLRHIAIGLIKNDKSTKLGINNKRLKVGWDESYLPLPRPGGERRMLQVRLLLVIGLLFSVAAWSHDLGLARVVLEETSENAYRLEAKLPVALDAADPVLPKHCTLNGPPRRLSAKLDQVLEWHFACAEPPTIGEMLVLPWDREGALLAFKAHDGETASLYQDTSQGDIRVPLEMLRAAPQSTSSVAQRYLVLGIEHILLGWDHIAFVLALCLLASGWRLAKLVTAFTVGHSVTLALAALGIARVPVPPVEVLIALSVALMAREVRLQMRDNRGQAGIHGSGLVLVFGLLHGLGFASALKEIGIGQGDLLLGLVSFNLGVEVGQLVFVLLVSALAMMGGGRISVPWLRPATGFVLGSLGVFWMLERTSGFLMVQ